MVFPKMNNLTELERNPLGYGFEVTSTLGGSPFVVHSWDSDGKFIDTSLPRKLIVNKGEIQGPKSEDPAPNLFGAQQLHTIGVDVVQGPTVTEDTFTIHSSAESEPISLHLTGTSFRCTEGEGVYIVQELNPDLPRYMFLQIVHFYTSVKDYS